MNFPSRIRLSLYALAVAALAGAVFAGALAAKPPHHAAAPKTVRISVKNSGKSKKTGGDFPAISSSGRLVAFETFARLTKNDKDAMPDVYLYNRSSHKVKLISVKTGGKPGKNLGADEADISPNGRYVCFASPSAFRSVDTNGIDDVYRHDLKTGTTVRISVTSAGTQLTGVNDGSELCGAANDGKVAFETQGAFDGADSNGYLDVYVRDPKKKTTKRASLDYNDNQIPDGTGTTTPDKQSKLAFSGNGRYVAFVSSTSTVTADPDTAFGGGMDSDVFVRDLKKGTTKRVSLKANGKEGAPPFSTSQSFTPSISSNGRYIAFATNGADGATPVGHFTSGDKDLQPDVYVKDMRTKKLKLASVTSGEKQKPIPLGGLAVDFPEISSNGRFVVFDTSENLGGGKDPAKNRDVYRRDLKKGKTKLISLGRHNKRVGTNQLADISSSGKWTAFSSMGRLVPGDGGNDFDAFLRGPVNP